MNAYKIRKGHLDDLLQKEVKDIKCNYVCLDMTKPLKHKSVKNLTNMD